MTIHDAVSAARLDARHYTKTIMAQHLLHDHELTVRQLGRRLGMTDREVRLATDGKRP